MSNNLLRKSTFLSFLRVWSILILLSIPIKYELLPSFGIWLNEFLLPLNRIICASIFQVDITNSYWISDSAGFYSLAIIWLFAATILFILKPVFRYLKQILVSKFNVAEAALAGFRSSVILNYVLAYFLLRYGLDKIIGEQFYFPAPNTLHTELGNLSKDILYWSTIGASKNYMLFMGFTEFFAGLLLIWNRTRFLGTLIAFGIMLNVFATNIGFDISVKFLSGSLLLASFWLLLGYSNQLKMFFGMPINRLNNETNPGRKLMMAFNILFLTVILLEFWIPRTKAGSYPFKEATYTITNHQGNSSIFDLESLKRMHIHREGYLIVEDTNQHFESLRILPSTNGFRLNKLNFAINKELNEITWQEESSTVKIFVHEKKLESLNLAKDEHHWFVEDLIP